MEAFVDKGSLQRYLAQIPVRVVLNSDAALFGAALYAQDRAPAAYRLAA